MTRLPVRTLLLVGCPGSGKGTIAKKIEATFPVAHLSSGDLLRSHVSRGTSLGLQVKAILSQGGLVEDHLVSRLVQESVGEMGTRHLLLDGFPRTVGQAKGLDEHLLRIGRRLDAVICLDVPEDVILKRINGIVLS